MLFLIFLIFLRMPVATNRPLLVFSKNKSVILEVPWISTGYHAGEMNQVATNHPLLVFFKKRCNPQSTMDSNGIPGRRNELSCDDLVRQAWKMNRVAAGWRGGNNMDFGKN